MLQTGARAPAFSLPLIGGGEFELSAALAKGPTLVAFVKSDCGACQTAFPYLQKLWARYQDTPWSFVIVAQDPPVKMASGIAKHGLTMPIATESGPWTVSKAYDPDATPTYFWIEPDGRITKTALGFTKMDLNQFAGLVAGKSDVEVEDIAPPDDGGPSFKPG